MLAIKIPLPKTVSMIRRRTNPSLNWSLIIPNIVNNTTINDDKDLVTPFKSTNKQRFILVNHNCDGNPSLKGAE